MAPALRTHPVLDRRSFASHRLIAARLVADPGLLDRARATLARWRRTASPGSMPYLDAWQALLESGFPACLSMFEEQSDRATALRQASPFSGILPPRERAEFFKPWARAERPPE